VSLADSGIAPNAYIKGISNVTGAESQLCEAAITGSVGHRNSPPYLLGHPKDHLRLFRPSTPQSSCTCTLVFSLYLLSWSMTQTLDTGMTK